MKVLVINAGSSSLKFQLIDMNGEVVIAKGTCGRVGAEMGEFDIKTEKGKFEKEVAMPDHTAAFQVVKEALTSGETKVIDSLDEISAIGHRVVQGGSLFKESTLVTDEVIEGIKSLCDLAPLHNPAHIQGINACIDVFGKDVPEVVVFDNAFHSTMPEEAYMFGIPYEYYEKYKIRRYGFHGTSHKYVSQRAAKMLGKDIKDLKIITCHIGNGSSITAVDGGKVVDTSMGLTPLDGIMMGTRTGCLDPSVVTFIADKENLSPKEMDTLLNKKSGLLGVSGVSSDDRDVTAAEEAGNERAHLAHEMLYYQIAKYIGQYYVAMGGCDAIVFTAGLGENQPQLRKKVCEYLKVFGVKFNDEFNEQARRGVTGQLSTDDSAIRVELIATNEELVIARDTQEIVSAL